MATACCQVNHWIIRRQCLESTNPSNQIQQNVSYIAVPSLGSQLAAGCSSGPLLLLPTPTSGSHSAPFPQMPSGRGKKAGRPRFFGWLTCRGNAPPVPLLGAEWRLAKLRPALALEVGTPGVHLRHLRQKNSRRAQGVRRKKNSSATT